MENTRVLITTATVGGSWLQFFFVIENHEGKFVIEDDGGLLWNGINFGSAERVWDNCLKEMLEKSNS